MLGGLFLEAHREEPPRASIVVTHHLAAVTANLVPLFKNDAQLIGWHGHVATCGTIAGAEAGDNEAEFVDRDATW